MPGWFAVADLEIDGRGATVGVDPPQIGRLEAVPPAGVQGAEPPLRSGSEAPQKLKPKNALEASQKAFR